MAAKSPQRDKARSSARRKNTATAEEPPKESQQEPEQDSGLQTPQPDQPMPTEVEREDQESRKDESPSPEQPEESPGEEPKELAKHVAQGGRSFRADVQVNDQLDVFAKQEAERAAAREVHNRRSAHRFDVLVEA